ncbi:uncharacterized protein J3R85_013598 [Psidium guajava]|nr:uncharacterized protein J3R85_013598 [Psidium guajava]
MKQINQRALKGATDFSYRKGNTKHVLFKKNPLVPFPSCFHDSLEDLLQFGIGIIFSNFAFHFLTCLHHP